MGRFDEPVHRWLDRFATCWCLPWCLWLIYQPEVDCGCRHNSTSDMCNAESTIAGEASGHSLQFQGMDSDPLLRFLGKKGTLGEEMEQMLSSKIPCCQGILEGEGTLGNKGPCKRGWKWWPHWGAKKNWIIQKTCLQVLTLLTPNPPWPNLGRPNLNH